MHNHRLQPRRVLAEGKFARLVAQDGWEWIERVNASGAVVIVPITVDREIVFVEQYRIPLARRVIELPAGLVGDVAGEEDEPLIAAARRELVEETGYDAAHWQAVAEGPSSAGLATEIYGIYLATEAVRVSAGGGDGTEDIDVHVVPLSEAVPWLLRKQQDGLMIDPKIYAGLYFASEVR